jgi:hypothetical protein
MMASLYLPMSGSPSMEGGLLPTKMMMLLRPHTKDTSEGRIVMLLPFLFGISMPKVAPSGFALEGHMLALFDLLLMHMELYLLVHVWNSLWACGMHAGTYLCKTMFICRICAMHVMYYMCVFLLCCFMFFFCGCSGGGIIDLHGVAHILPPLGIILCKGM